MVSRGSGRVYASPTVAHARLQFAATSPLSLSVSPWGEIRVKVTAAFLAGKCENSQNENQMQTPAGAKGNRTKESGIFAREKCMLVSPPASLSLSLSPFVLEVHPQNSL